jgi:hypothetical protein
MVRKVGWQRRNASRGPPPDYVFFFGRSARSSRNSPGPFRSRRFLCCCSSAVADGSASLSICWPARSMAFDVAFGLRRFMSCDPASPSSTSRRMASERSGLSVCLAAQASTFSRNSDESRIAVTGSRPVAGLALFFRTTFLRDAFIFLVLPKEATTTCPKDRGRACGMGVRGQSWRASATTTAAPINVGGALLTSGAFRHFEPLRMESCREGAHNTRERLLRSRQGPLLGHRGRSVPREEGPLGPRYPRKFVLA